MPYDEEQRRRALKAFVEANDLKIAPWAKRAGLAEATLRDFLSGRNRTLTDETYEKLAAAANVSAAVLRGEGLVPSRLNGVMIRGAVQAGIFREALEWPEDEWRAAPVAKLGLFAHLPQFGFEVRGPSMNRVYPPGSTIVCVNWFDAGLDPKGGQRVVVLRRDPHGTDGFEATVKELQIDDDGVFWLWPRSTDPRYQEPWRVESLSPSDDNDDVRIAALVIGAFIPEVLPMELLAPSKKRRASAKRRS